ncbi:MAG: hypothetical protein PHX87_04435 [Candidatus Peribacteraceae bacterium]|nr:hypothetical protein [Candidatus Peribacteraceae bacterium]MDD5742646.1 hypothetical protein [Candidatus Peribacteraceae bacterium]
MNFLRAIAGLPALLKRPAFVLQVLVTDFLPWVLWQEPLNILRGYFEYARAFSEILSVPFLLKTLLSPWKGIAEEMPSVVRWDQFLQAFFVNLVTRMIGMVIRLLAILLSIVLQVVLFALFAVLFVGWFVFPIIAIGMIAVIFIIV